MPPTAIVRPAPRLLYGLYAWFILLFVVVPVAAACLLLPGVERRRRVARLGAAAILWMIGSPVAVRGTPLAAGDTAIVVANHQSYLDGIILTAVLPPQYMFLIKREMVRVPIAGFVLHRLGSEFVDRSSPNRRHQSARRLVGAAKQGKGLAVFPEGTFDATPGLKAFRMGAFKAARLGGLAIQPVVIKGARQKLPSARWLPRPGPLTVEFCEQQRASDFSDDTALMQATRRTMLECMHEPDLALVELGPREDAP